MSDILSRLSRWSAFKEFSKYAAKAPRVAADGVWKGSRSFLLACLFRENPVCSLVVTPSIAEAQNLYDELSILLPSGVYHFPFWEVLPREDSTCPDDIVAERYQLVKAQLKDPQIPKIVVAPVQSFLFRGPTLKCFGENILTLKPGGIMKITAVSSCLVQNGYERVNLVECRGQWAARGGILDIFNMADPWPVRAEFEGDRIVSIRMFDTKTQRTKEEISEVMIFPANEWLLLNDKECLVNLAELLAAGRICLIEEERIYDQAGNFELSYQSPHVSYMGSRSLEKELGKFPVCTMGLVLPLRENSQEPRVRFSIASYSQAKSSYKDMGETLKSQQEAGFNHTFCFHNDGEQKRLTEYWQEKNIPLCLDSAHVIYGHFEEGFFVDEIRLGVVTDDELFGRYKERRGKPRFRRGTPIENMYDLRPGDYVVHIDHGIGLYRGVEKVEQDGVVRDYLVITYDDEMRLLVPIEQINLIERYIGLEGKKPKLNRIGTAAWVETKAKVARVIRDIASDLLRFQAVRSLEQGIAYPPDHHWQKEFEDAFIYEETYDQIKAIEDIKRDMESSRPMDRLICGDVGYGKTEVAMRAAFKAVMHAKQVAFLVPTTILAEQHYETFSERMREYPVKIACLTRFNTPEESRSIREGIKDGGVDIVIGTHKLLFGSMVFKDLGLLVIDEEQRFGVMHKERLKKYRMTVDILTLSATPIPRTLYMSLTGAKDLSLLNTPPEDRLPIQTHVISFNDSLIKDAIRRELARGGQIYFVHNRVFNIERFAKKIRRLVPEARVGVGHGQMQGRTLETVMKKLVNRETDVLVSTTIIQSGLDIPNVNTMFINEADKYGLADLYQLRGRVGRFKHRGYCYLIVSQDRVVTEEAAKRLRIIEEFTELGSGMKIALRDLEIRGAGNILGIQQSGFIVEIGFELYCKLLERTIRELKGEHKQEEDVVLDLKINIGIPEDYISDERQRLDVFRKLANVSTSDDLTSMKEELTDRFGRIPAGCQLLLETSRLRIKAREHGISYLGLDKDYLVYVRGNTRKRYHESLGGLSDHDRICRVREIIETL